MADETKQARTWEATKPEPREPSWRDHARNAAEFEELAEIDEQSRDFWLEMASIERREHRVKVLERVTIATIFLLSAVLCALLMVPA